jgi:delta8-fatty-acid desaturase
MSAYRIGRIDYPWKNFKPPIRGGTFRAFNDGSEKQAIHQQELGQDIKDAKDVKVIIADVEHVERVDIVLEGKGLPEELRKEDAGNTCRRRVSDPERAISMGSELLRVPSPSISNTSVKSRDDHIQDAMDAEIEDNLAQFPSPDAETQSAITAKYYALHQKVQAGGYYKCDYMNYVRELARYSTIFGLFLFTLKSEWYFTSAFFLACFWQQIMFTAHDAGHRGITGRFIPDTMIGIFIADFCTGLSIGWWKSSHNVHHLVTNSPEHDPDIQNTPLFATCPSQFSDTKSSYYNFVFVWDKACTILIPYQKYAYYPVMAIARFNLYLLSWCHLLSPRSRPLGAAWWTRPAEIVAMCCYWTLFGYLLCWRTLPDWYTRVGFVLISHTSGMLLHVQITLSHWGMPTCDLGEDESFAQKQLRTTMDVLCPVWFDWVHGGLQFQAIHHLFPRVPRHNLRKLQPLVKEFCADTGIKYSIKGFVDGNTQVLGRLHEISNQLAMLGQCQDHMATTGESGLH